jgi:RimJ/RimL family protein N-acetyltransferase
MAFGPKMSLSVGELSIELAPLTKEVMGEFVAGMGQHTVTKYLGLHFAPTLEDEFEWYDKTRTDNSKIVWGIWDVTGEERILIGNTALTSIEKKHIHQATSGSMIFRKEYWGKGIASHIHKARTWYAFEQLGLHRVRSAVIHGNAASLKALEKSGYNRVYVERNSQFVDGKLHHQDNLECLNPADSFWAAWWHGERPTAQAIAARSTTREALKWAKDNVNLA